MRASCLLPVLVSLASFGCDDGTSERWALEELRVLGIRAEPAEVRPGDAVALDALVVDPLGEGRPVQRTWAVCTPDPSLGEASCSEPGRTVPLSTGTAATFTVPGNALDGLDPATAERGIDLYVVLAAQAAALPGGADEDGEVAIKRVRVSTDAAPNANPALLYFAPANPPDAGERVLLQAAASEDSRESFLGPLGPADELLRFSWYVTDGSLARGVTLGEPYVSSLDWKAALPATLYVVLRDERGGIDWALQEVGE